MDTRNVARGLAWFGIALGLAELLAPRRVAVATGLEGREGVIRAFGVREIASGLAVLAAEDPGRMLGARVVGDALDGGVLATGLSPSNPGRSRTLAALAAVAPVVALDVVCWLEAEADHRRAARAFDA